MMKSFFKKLAFTMAAAMVVSAAAPAGQAAYAADELDIALQSAKSNAEALTSYDVEVGETVDFKFYGEPNYKTLNPTWSSDLEAVAKVDQSGKVTGVKDGFATITFEVSNGKSGSIEIKVGDPVVYDVALGTAKDATFSTLTLAKGDEKDLGFFGVKDWKASNYKCEWSVEGDAVTVDNKTGVVTAVKAGEATVNFSIVNKTNGVAHKVTPVVVTVTDNSFVAEQVSDSVATITFADKDITKAEVEAGLEFYYYIGEQKVTYPVEVTKVDKGVATITNYVFFEDGKTYGFNFAGENDEFTAVIGKVVSIDFTWSCRNDLYKAYYGMDTNITPVLRNAAGKDITKYALAQGGTITYELLTNAPNGEYWISDPINGKIYFTEASAAQVKVVYTEYSKDTYEKTLELSETHGISAQAAPIYAIDMTAGNAATIATKGTVPSAIDWSKTTTTIAKGDDSAKNKMLVVKLKDNLGATVYAYNVDDNVNGDFRFKSTNESILFVDRDGTLAANTPGTARVLVYLDVLNTATGTTVSTVVAVVDVTVAAERAVTTVDLDKATDAVSTDAPFNTTTFKVTTKDQLGGKWNAWATEVTCNNTNLPAGVVAPSASIYFVEQGVYNVSVIASAAALPANTTAYTYTYTVKINNSLTRTFTVTVRKPGTDVTGYKIEFGGTDDIKTMGASTTAVVGAKSNTFKFFEMSNGVKKAQVNSVSARPTDNTQWKVGAYYYTVTKDGAAVTSTGRRISLTALNPVDANVVAAASGNALALPAGSFVVNKGANGVGTYTVVVYKGVGTYGATAGTTASALTQVATNTLTVKDSQDTMAYAGKVANTAHVGTLEQIIKSTFKFTIGNTTLDATDGTDDFVANNIVVVPNCNYIGANNVPNVGTVCYVSSVDFYKLVGQNGGNNVYVKYTVNVNQTVEITQ